MVHTQPDAFSDTPRTCGTRTPDSVHGRHPSHPRRGGGS